MSTGQMEIQIQKQKIFISVTCGIYKINKHNILESYIELNITKLSYDVVSYCAVEAEKQLTVSLWV